MDPYSYAPPGTTDEDVVTNAWAIWNVNVLGSVVPTAIDQAINAYNGLGWLP